MSGDTGGSQVYRFEAGQSILEWLVQECDTAIREHRATLRFGR